MTAAGNKRNFRTGRASDGKVRTVAQMDCQPWAVRPVAGPQGGFPLVKAGQRLGLNAAVREGLIPGNPLAQVRLDKPVRPRAVIWTDERVEAWRRDGIRPPVAVWTLRQLVTFLVGVENDRLAALWWLRLPRKDSRAIARVRAH
jgi:hypothetical protein